jgi:hypothetical protein
MAKPSIRDMQRKKPELAVSAAPVEAVQAVAGPAAKGDGRKGVLVRLSPEGWHLLGVLAGELTLSTGERHTKQSLMVDALNSLLKGHGKPPLA